ncbi:hypothetical protein AB0L13_02720 [Saccharopolyspora shandongensis]|uniref:hypothetical protein n=1 Tax=Saccharopolyspora shandongensis TaxID=418495 RepID=UPI003434BA93
MTELQETLQELAAHHGIPSAVVGVAEDGRIEAEAAGNCGGGCAVAPAGPWRCCFGGGS